MGALGEMEREREGGLGEVGTGEGIVPSSLAESHYAGYI